MQLEPQRICEESLWFGSPDRPLFGRLTTPASEMCAGGVLLSPPIGRESRLARRALRSLAIHLASDGYVSLRFDHFGTGDSSGSTDDEELDELWIEGVGHGVALLRSLGIESVSAVGMRMGATIVGTAASAHDLGLSSFAMWDPCETGRAYVREIEALGALHPVVATTGPSEPTKMLEYALSDDAESRVNRFTLREPTARKLAERVLIIVRDDRAVTGKFRARWDSEGVEWFSTSEQGALLESQIPTSLQPVETIAKLRAWLSSTPSPLSRFLEPPRARGTIVAKGSGAFAVRESVAELGANSMFGIISEPMGEVRGPLMVMVNGVNEDHVGPARLWVDLARRWAALGLRSVRFDLSELGESPWLPGQPDRSTYDKTRAQDIEDAVRAVNAANPSDAVLVGYCSGGQLAIESALNLKARGVCAINPQIATSVFRSVDKVKNSERGTLRTVAERINRVLRRHRTVDRALRRIARAAISFAHPPNVRPALNKARIETLLVLSPDDLSPLRRLPILRRRLTSTEHFQVEIVPTMDHAILSTLGRERAVAVLNQYVVETYAPDLSPKDR